MVERNREVNPNQQKLNQLDKKSKANPVQLQKYKKVNDLLFAYKQVDAKTKLVTINQDTADQFKKTISLVTGDIKKVNSNNKLKNGKQIVGLANSLKDAIIKPNFVGLSHYKNLLSDTETWFALYHTVIFTVISVAIEFVLGLAIAILINKAFFGRGLVRAAILIPWPFPQSSLH